MINSPIIQQYHSLENITVKNIAIYAIGPNVKKVTFGSHLGLMYEAMIVASLKLSNGVEALAGLTTYTEHEYDMTAFSSAIQMAPFVLGKKKNFLKSQKFMKICEGVMSHQDIFPRHCLI